MANPILVGIKRISDTLKGMYVRDENAVERCVYDTDGALYQGGTKITATAAQLNGTAPNISGAAISTSNIADCNIYQTDLNAHDYGAAAVDWTLSSTEQQGMYCQASNASGAVNAIVPVTMKVYYFQNSTGQTLTVKTAAGTGVAIANAKGAFVFCNGTNVIRMTADA